MKTYNELQELINNYIKSEVIYNGKEPNRLYNPIDYIMSIGGKRIRPALVLMACNLFSERIEPALSASIAMEIFHNFTLVHDDIMDKAPVRRGKATVHTKWDDNVGILSGDAMLIVAYEYLSKSPAEKIKSIIDVFNQTALEVCEGQQYDMDFEKTDGVSDDEYLEMIRLKTSVLLAACLKIGATLGGATNEDANNLYNFGINMGLAFQLQDDLLDVYGDSKTFGKQTGGDIIANKKTFLLVNALEQANGKSLKELKHWITQKEFDADEKVNAVKEIYNKLGIDTLTKNKIDKLYEQSLTYLEKVSVREANKTELRNIVDTLMGRCI